MRGVRRFVLPIGRKLAGSYGQLGPEDAPMVQWPATDHSLVSVDDTWPMVGYGAAQLSLRCEAIVCGCGPVNLHQARPAQRRVVVAWR
jgi:hypothetical protein